MGIMVEGARRDEECVEAKAEVSSGAFYDMNNFLLEDNEFNLAEMNGPVFEKGQFKDQQFFIPINYVTPLLITTKAIQEEYNFKLTDITSMEELESLMEGVQLENQEMTMLAPERFVVTFFMDRGLKFYDLDNKQVNLRTPEFKEAVEDYIKFKEFAKDDEALDELEAKITLYLNE